MPQTNMDFWKKKLERNKQRDEEVISELRNLGWNVIIVWQCEIRGKLFEPRMEILIKQIKGKTIY